jgi:hypothetical protein
MTEFYYDPDHDTNDHEPWSEMDIDDLKASAESGDSLKDAARFLCRSGALEDVKQKAAELGVRFCDAVEVIPWETQDETYGVSISHPGRTAQSYRVGTLIEAHREAQKLRRSFTELGRITHDERG